jgi:hypothetical protein
MMIGGEGVVYAQLWYVEIQIPGIGCKFTTGALYPIFLYPKPFSFVVYPPPR